jgi:hypothetical protein
LHCRTCFEQLYDKLECSVCKVSLAMETEKAIDNDNDETIAVAAED